jgi:hypothetical protein
LDAQSSYGGEAVAPVWPAPVEATGTGSRRLQNASTDWVDSGVTEKNREESMKTSKVRCISSFDQKSAASRRIRQPPLIKCNSRRLHHLTPIKTGLAAPRVPAPTTISFTISRPIFEPRLPKQPDWRSARASVRRYLSAPGEKWSRSWPKLQVSQCGGATRRVADGQYARRSTTHAIGRPSLVERSIEIRRVGSKRAAS